MKQFIQITIIFIFFCFSSSLYADDTDIYLESGATNSAPPYVMITLDYRSATFSTFCDSIDGCIDDLSPNSYAYFCSRFAFENADVPAWLTKDAQKRICKKRWRDIDADGNADYQF